ncbi:2-dehydropantoate 2-reductase N-terminal domain-containing protein [Paenibacillus sp.]|uniref:ketopantoate reductase family protein n=1 Tax=Paenibacillus sp. TaxID=58172 RepID=UPI00281DCC85|nr:2-dehydropantoate 2-reductase N-terminal domain-containing protein [Paenibacillus sp.]MDR0268637.1 ketopantoate reductase family protein [Paenibacillus sp.]
MKVLVYGAGIIGSYLTHVLLRGGHDVTILARGKRAEELERNGIVLQHYFQYKTTVDRIYVIRTLEADQEYDLIFVTMKYTDYPSVLPILAGNLSRNIVFVGNNTDIPAMQKQKYIQDHSLMPKNIAFGFQLCAGWRENERMVILRGKVKMMLGGAVGQVSFKPLLDQVFSKTKFKLAYHNDIDAWLKCHIIPILMLSSGGLAKNGRMNEVAKDKKLLRQMITAMDEGFSVLEALGYTITPANQVRLIRRHKRILHYMLKMYHLLPIAKMMQNSFGEMVALNRDFDDWKKKSNIPTPHWDLLEKQFISET